VIKNVLVDAFGREIIRWGLSLGIPGRRESVVVGEIVLGEQTIGDFSKWVSFLRMTANVGRHLIVVLDAVDPNIGDRVTLRRWTSACRLAFIELAEHVMVSGLSSSAS
jgi:hypothetical protein